MGLEDEPLIPHTEEELYKKVRTQHTDTAWKFAYFFMLAACGAGGYFAFINRSVDFRHLGPDYLSKAENCPVIQPKRLLLEDRVDLESFDLNEFWHVAKYWLVGTLLLSSTIGSLFVLLFQTAAITVVWTCVALMEIFFITFAVVASQSQPAYVTAILLLIPVLLAYLAYKWRTRLILCGQLLSVASKALVANPLLVLTVVSLGVASAAALLLLCALLVLGLANGSLHRTLHAIPDSDSSNLHGCLDDKGSSVTCCTWRVDLWAQIYVGLIALVMMWTWSIACQLQAYTIAGTTAQWYFIPAQMSTMRPFSSAANIGRSVSHGLSTSFGSLCLSGFVEPIVQEAKSFASNFGFFSTYCLMGASLLEAISKFAVVSMAITGQSFIGSGRSVTGVLRRNLLSSVGVWTFPPMILSTTCFVLAVVWGLFVIASAGVTWSLHPQGELDALLLGAIAYIASMLVLKFYSTVLINVIDACYICWAMDLDNSAVTRPEIHDIYSAVPSGTLVLQPDEGLAYGASTADTVVQTNHLEEVAAPPSRAFLGPLLHETVPAPKHYND